MPNEPYPILPVEHALTGREEPMYIRPAREPGWCELVRAYDGVAVALLKRPRVDRRAE